MIRRLFNPAFWAYLREEFFPTKAEITARDERLQAYWQQRAARERQACDICSGRDTYLCPKCGGRITVHSHENDYICDTHGLVNPVRLSDAARISGDGRCGSARVM